VGCFCPGRQGKHDPLLATLFVYPAGQLEQVLPSVPPRYFPATQSSQALVMSLSTVPAPQSLHVADPSLLVLPEGQASH